MECLKTSHMSEHLSEQLLSRMQSTNTVGVHLASGKRALSVPKGEDGNRRLTVSCSLVSSSKSNVHHSERFSMHL